VSGTSGTGTWTTRELALRLHIPEDEVRRRAFTLGLSAVIPERYPLRSLAFLRAQQQGEAICIRCFRTGEPGSCECGKASRRKLPEPEPAA
jgi:hypothetical protein